MGGKNNYNGLLQRVLGRAVTTACCMSYAAHHRPDVAIHQFFDGVPEFNMSWASNLPSIGHRVYTLSTPEVFISSWGSRLEQIIIPRAMGSEDGGEQRSSREDAIDAREESTSGLAVDDVDVGEFGIAADNQTPLRDAREESTSDLVVEDVDVDEFGIAADNQTPSRDAREESTSDLAVEDVDMDEFGFAANNQTPSRDAREEHSTASASVDAVVDEQISLADAREEHATASASVDAVVDEQISLADAREEHTTASASVDVVVPSVDAREEQPTASASVVASTSPKKKRKRNTKKWKDIPPRSPLRRVCVTPAFFKLMQPNKGFSQVKPNEPRNRRIAETNVD